MINMMFITNIYTMYLVREYLRRYAYVIDADHISKIYLKKCQVHRFIIRLQGKYYGWILKYDEQGKIYGMIEIWKEGDELLSSGASFDSKKMALIGKSSRSCWCK